MPEFLSTYVLDSLPQAMRDLRMAAHTVKRAFVMRTLKFRVADLMVAIVIIAIGFSALRYPSLLWASILYTLTMAFLCTATVFAILGHGQRRATSVGITIFGWTYFILTYLTFLHSKGNLPQPVFIDSLIFNYARYILSPALGPWVVEIVHFTHPDPGHYAWIGSLLGTAIFAYIGKWIGHMIVIRDDN